MDYLIPYRLCRRGHIMATENVYVRPRGAIECRRCRAINAKRYHQSDKGKAARKSWDARHPNKVREYQRAYVDRNREEIRRKDRERQRKKAAALRVQVSAQTKVEA